MNLKEEIIKSVFLVCFNSKRQFWTPFPPQLETIYLKIKISNIRAISFSHFRAQVVHKSKAYRESFIVAERISRMKDSFFRDKVSSNKIWRLFCFMMSVGYFRAIFKNLPEELKMFDILPNAKII